MSELKFPIYVLEKDDDSVFEFSTIVAIQQHLEAIDVENGEYTAWDADGRCLKLSVGQPKSEWLKVIPAEGEAIAKEFTALKDRAEKRTEYPPYEPLSKRIRRWFGRS
ncbi:MAG: hypothetical protein HY233_05235 [Acidobacteriales bacterium]|nr:hypothetical protein [Terriglobales bacterium]